MARTTKGAHRIDDIMWHIPLATTHYTLVASARLDGNEGVMSKDESSRWNTMLDEFPEKLKQKIKKQK